MHHKVHSPTLFCFHHNHIIKISGVLLGDIFILQMPYLLIIFKKNIIYSLIIKYNAVSLH